MRISTSMLYTGGAAQIDNLQAQLVQQQEEISTGTSILTPADNPVNAAQAVVVTQSQSDNTQFATNRQGATNSLSQEETTLQGVTTLIQNAQTAIVDAGNGSYTLQERQAIATGLQGTYNQLLGLANAQDGNGNYLFSGYQNGVQPFSAINGGAQYNGSQGETSVQVSVSQTMAIGDSGASVFMNNVTGGNGSFTTTATPGNAGSGIISGGAVVNAAQLNGGNYSVNFSGSQTAAAATNTGTGIVSPSTAALGGALPTGDTFAVNFTSPSTYDLVDQTTGNTVSSGDTYLAGQAITAGGSQFSITGAPAAGDQFTVQDLPTTYSVSQYTLQTGAGVNTVTGLPNGGSAVISQASLVDPTAVNTDTYDLNFHVVGGVTTYDVVDATTNATISAGNPFAVGQPISVGGMQVSISGNPADGDQFTAAAPNPPVAAVASTPYVSGQAITFDGMQFNVTGSPSGGTPTPGDGTAAIPPDSFTINPSPRESIFTTLTNLMNLLNTAPSGTGPASETQLTNGLNTANNNLSSALNNVLTVRASIGARLNELTSLNTQGQSLDQEYATTLSSLQDLNYAQAISNFTQQQTTLSAAQQSFVKIAGLSLFNYL